LKQKQGGRRKRVRRGKAPFFFPFFVNREQEKGGFFWVPVDLLGKPTQRERQRKGGQRERERKVRVVRRGRHTSCGHTLPVILRGDHNDKERRRGFEQSTTGNWREQG